MVEFLIFLKIVILIMLGAVNMALYARVTRSDREKKADEKVQAAMDDAAEEEARRSRDMDEGVENLMRCSVKLGHGKTTGGEP